jgi:hypothetical protein
LGTSNMYMILCRNLTNESWVIFTTCIASIHLVNVLMVTNKNLKLPDALDRIDSPDCEMPRKFNRPNRISMLRSLLLEDLAIPAFGDDFHRIILSYWPVETMYEGFPNDGTP